MSETAAIAAGGGWRNAEILANPSLGARRVDAPVTTCLYEPSTPAVDLYFIESGQVRVYQMGPDDSARLADILGPGDWFGTAALARAGTYGARAVVVTPSVVWLLPAERLRRLLCEEPRLATDLVEQLAQRLQAAQEAAARLVFDDCNQRLVQTLLRFSRTAAAVPHQGGDVELQITHRQLAQAVGAARETVSLALTQLRQRNLLRTGRNRVFFNPVALQQFYRRTARPSY